MQSTRTYPTPSGPGLWTWTWVGALALAVPGRPREGAGLGLGARAGKMGHPAQRMALRGGLGGSPRPGAGPGETLLPGHCLLRRGHLSGGPLQPCPRGALDALSAVIVSILSLCLREPGLPGPQRTPNGVVPAPAPHTHGRSLSSHTHPRTPTGECTQAPRTCHTRTSRSPPPNGHTAWAAAKTAGT